MTIKEFFESAEELAIHCNTLSKAKKLLEAFDSEGYTWSTGYRYIIFTLWGDCKEETCYDNENQYCSRKWYKKYEYKILEFEDIEI